MAKIIEVDEKEVQVVEKKVNKAIATAESVVVTSDEEMLEAGELRKTFKELGKEIDVRKKEITDPLNKALKSARALFAPLEEGFDKATDILSRKMLTYQNEQERKRRKEEEEANRKLEEAQKKLEEGKITEKQAEAVERRVETKLEKTPEVIKRSEDFHTRTITKVKVMALSTLVHEDESDPNRIDEATLKHYISKGYVVWDEVMVRRAVLGGVEIKGAEKYEEKTLV